MIKKRNWFFTIAIFCTVILLGVGCSNNEAYPDRPVELINPWAAGGSHDAHSRVIANSMEEYLGKPMTVAVKEGGGGAVGAGFTAKSDPDGYTLLLGDQSSVIIRPMLEQLPYTWEDFTPIFQFNDSPIIFVTPIDRPWETLEEYVAAAKENPGEINYGSVAGLGPDQVPIERFRLEAGLDLTHVPFPGGGGAYQSILAGDIDASPLFLATVKKDLDEGRLRALAVTSPERLEELPDVPTFKELGYDVEWAMFRTIFGPKDMDPEVVKILEEAFTNMAEDDELKKNIKNLGENVNYLTGQELKDRLATEAKVLEELIQQVE